MTTNLTLAVVAAAAVVAGALIGGGAQAWVSASQHTHDRENARRLAKTEVYSEVCGRGVLVPALMTEGATLTPAEAEKVVGNWGARFDLLRADLSLFAPPEVRGLANDIRPALAKMRDALREKNRLGPAPTMRTLACGSPIMFNR